MLNLETTVIKILEESYKSTQLSNTILGIILIIVSIGIGIWAVIRDYPYIIGLILVIVGAICFASGFMLTIEGHAPYYEVTVEVEPTEELTIEKLKNNDNFIEIDNKMYFKTKIDKRYRQSIEDFQNKENLEKEINKKFEDVIGKIWIKDKIVK